MSYILDALRRAERDRLGAQTPIEQIAVTPAEPPQPPRAAMIAWISVAIAVIASTAAAMVWWTHHAPSSAPAATAPIPTLIPAGSAHVEKVAPVAATPVAAATVRNPIADANRLGSMDDLMPRPRAATPAPARQTSHSTPSVATEVSSPSAPAQTAATASPITTSPLPAAATSDDSPAPVSQANTMSATTALPDTATTPPLNPAALKTMPDSYRASFPSLSVEVHVYDTDPSKRWVLIDGHRYREGDTLPSGPKIVEIVPQGIVFDWQGQRVLDPVTPP